MKLTAINDVILSVVPALQAAVSYPVYDGPIAQRAARGTAQYLVIGAEDPDNGEDVNPVNSASMSQTWRGLGQRARDETLQIPCVACGKAATVAAARELALSAAQDAFDNLSIHPTDETYNALVSDVTGIESKNTTGGAVVYAKFVITANARLV